MHLGSRYARSLALVSMTKRNSEISRVHALKRGCGVTLKVLSRIISKDHSDNKSKRYPKGYWNLKKDVDSTVYQDTPYGPLIQQLPLPTDGDKPYILDFLSPFALLHVMCSLNSRFALLLHTASQRGQLRLAIYTDEACPGNVLHPDTTKETQCIFFTFCDLPDWWDAQPWGPYLAFWRWPVSIVGPLYAPRTGPMGVHMGMFGCASLSLFFLCLSRPRSYSDIMAGHKDGLMHRAL